MSQSSDDGFWSSVKQSLEENPLLLVYAGAAGLVLIIIIAVLVLLFSGGGGDGNEAVSGRTPTPTVSASPTVTAQPTGPTATATATPSGPLPAVSEVAPDLDFFGSLAAVNSQPVTTTFSTTADSLELPDGSTLDVPDGAFSAPTNLTIAIVDLEFDRYLSTPPDGRVYVLATEVDISLGAPVVLDVPKASDSVVAGEFTGSGWAGVSLEPGDTTRIELDYFSSRTIAVSDDTSTNPLRLRSQAFLQHAVSRNLLVDCMISVGYLFNEAADDSGFVQGVAFQVCAQALPEAPPSASTVDLQCVSDELDAGLQAAVNGCQSSLVTEVPTATPSPTPPSKTPTPTPSPTKNPTIGVLEPGQPGPSAVLDGSCSQQSEGANISCSYLISVNASYQVSELPAQIRCAIQPQIPNFSPIEPGIADLGSKSGTVTITATATAQFESDGTPLYSTPTLVECVLRRPIGAGEYNTLDSILVDVDLPGPNI